MASTRRCPQCDAPAPWGGNPHRPFCSERCRMLDLDGWLGERYAIPGEPVPEEIPGEVEDVAGAPRSWPPRGRK